MNDQKILSRRRFLQGSLIGLGTAAAPLLLSACGGTPPQGTTSATSAPTGGETAATSAPNAAVEPTTAPSVASSDLEIVTSGWPLTPMPSTEEMDKEPQRKGYASALQEWLDQNPGVTFKQIEANIWDQQSIVTLISGGTAPLYVYAQAIGGWSTAGTRAAFVQGLFADTTPVVEKYGLKSKLTDLAKASWEPYGVVDGKYINYPIDSGVGNTVMYRKDLVKQLSLKEPTDDWTWEDLRALAKGLTSDADKRKGIGMTKTGAGEFLGAHGFDILSTVPTPNTGWNWERDFSDPRWTELSNEFRSMVFEDKSVFSDATATNNDIYSKAFVDGTIGIWQSNILGAFGPPADASSYAALAKRLNKPYQEVIGFAAAPKGDGFRNGGAYVGGVAFSPDASPELLDKGASAVDFMFLGKGWDVQKAGQYEATKDLQAVFNYPLPIDGKYTYEGVPGSFADAWGQETLDAAKKVAGIPIAPETGLFLPAEKNAGPGDDAIRDTWSNLLYVADQVDPAQELKTAQDTWNQQAGGFSSSISDDDFVASTKNYYAALSDFLKQNTPEFYEQRFKPWYDSKIAPVVG